MEGAYTYDLLLRGSVRMYDHSLLGGEWLADQYLLYADVADLLRLFCCVRLILPSSVVCIEMSYAMEMRCLKMRHERVYGPNMFLRSDRILLVLSW